MTPRPITAKFPSKCATCGEPIVPGQRILWAKGEPSSHEKCAQGEPVVSRKREFAPTSEQVHALELFATGNSLAIEAGAGTGKTSTLILLAESTDRRGQYIAFNKAIVAEAGEKMPGNVACSTAHSLAYKAVGAKYGDRLRQSRRMRSIDIAAHLDVRPIKLTLEEGTKIIGAGFLGGLVMSAITRFCQSADPEPTRKHVPFIEGIDRVEDGVRSYDNNNAIAKRLEPALAKAWADLIDLHGKLPFRHDHYLKLWQLSDPKIAADFILFDEAQDANPVMVAIVAAQTHAQLVWVGDSQQQIYTFTGAVNALAHVPADSKAFLTQSFRFGHAIAGEANRILDMLSAELSLVGTESIQSTVGPVDEPDAILTRTNAAAVRTVLSLQLAGRKVALVGGGDEVVRFAKAAQELMDTGHTDYPDLACFDSWGEVQQYVEEDEQGGELRLMVKLVTDFTVPTILAALERMIPERQADVIVSTAHKSKGREWDRVQLAGDFPPGTTSKDELRLLYVAVTRAKRDLDIESILLADQPADEEEE
jgi:hypothetical protein